MKRLLVLLLTTLLVTTWSMAIPSGASGATQRKPGSDQAKTRWPEGSLPDVGPITPSKPPTPPPPPPKQSKPRASSILFAAPALAAGVQAPNQMPLGMLVGQVSDEQKRLDQLQRERDARAAQRHKEIQDRLEREMRQRQMEEQRRREAQREAQRRELERRKERARHVPE